MRPRRRRWLGENPTLALAVTACASLLAIPLAVIVISFLQPAAGETLVGLSTTVLPGYIINSALLSLYVGLGVAIIGTGSAWLVTACDFPGRRAFEWLLVLPLAFPAYVMAYAYTEFLSHPGPVQTLLRDVTGWGPRDYWFPRIRSLEGAAVMFTFVLYPYVYLLARTAFLTQSVAAFEAARVLGKTPWRAFMRVALPMARPAIVIGVALALMETLADYGTVAHFAVPTFTTGIYRSWFSMGDRVAAAQLAGALLMFVFVLIWIERVQRGAARYQTARGTQPIQRFRLRPLAALGAVAFCTLPLAVGFVIPGGMLIDLAAGGGHSLFGPRYAQFIRNSLLLASLAALITVVIAVALPTVRRLSKAPVLSVATRFASLGYAVPGSIIAVGILIPMAGFDNALDAFMRERFGISTGLILTGTIFGLLFAYTVRFLAVALAPVESAFERITPHMDDAARVLGARKSRVFSAVHAPLLRGGILTGALIVFVDVMKELPATLILRPFNFETLATQAFRLASDERLSEAATPSLVIVAVGLLPVFLLSRQIRRLGQTGRERRDGP
ncbi:MAG: iron ABC transporter permease [Devosiaceae bacterium]|nr:iron ABC transporter permease [Devosiaceae bacterium MH13]